MKTKIVFCLTAFLVSSNAIALAAGTAKKPQQKPVPSAGKKTAGQNSGQKTGGSWNSQLTDMMNNLQNELGPGAKPSADTNAEGEQETEFSTAPDDQPDLPPNPLAPDFAPGQSPSMNSGAPSSVPPGSTVKFQLMDPTKGSPDAWAALGAPSTGDNYFAEIEKVGLTRWNSSRLPLKVFIEKTSSAKGFQPEFVDVMRSAFLDWSHAVPNLQVEFVPEAKDAQVVCTWTDNKADLMNPQEGGNTVIVPDANGIFKAEVKVYSVPPDKFSTMPQNYLKTVALHEAGHAVGLTGHSNKPDDIMYGIIYPKDEVRQLSVRDKNTLKELYGREINAGDRLDASTVKIAGDSKNPKVRAMQLNNEAAKALNANQLSDAENKLTEAHRLDPTNKLVAANLGSLFANVGSLAAMTFNVQLAVMNFKKAIPLLEQSGNKSALIQVLTNYATILRQSNNTAELKTVEAKLRSLQ